MYRQLFIQIFRRTGCSPRSGLSKTRRSFIGIGSYLFGSGKFALAQPHTFSILQMLFEKGYEFGETEGLGLIPGCVQLIDGGGLKIPHMGWNDLTVLHECHIRESIPIPRSHQTHSPFQKASAYPDKSPVMVFPAMYTEPSFIRKKVVR